MPRLTTPALAPAAAILAGLGLARQLPVGSVPLAVALCGLTWALGTRWGRLVACLAAGMAGGWAAVSPLTTWDPERPVSVVGRPAGHWTSDGESWRMPLRAERVRQGRRVERWPGLVWVSLPADRSPPDGARLRLRGYLRRPPPAANGVPARAGAWRLRVKSLRFVESLDGGPRGLAIRGAQRLRAAVEADLAAVSRGSGGAAVARALVLGDTGALPGATLRGLRRAGLAHLVAISGLHVGLLIACVVLLGAWLPPPLRYGLAAVAVALYLALVGPRPGLVRASLMAGWTTLSLRAERPPNAPHALASIAAAAAWSAPRLLDDLGFVLTVAATGGLLLAAPALAEAWSGLPAWLRRPLAASVGAQLATLPWALPAFHLLSPLAPLWNLLAVPWTALVLVASLLWTATAALSPAAATWSRPLLDLAATPYELLGAIPARLSPPLVVSGIGWWSGLLIAGAIYLVLLHPRRLLAWGAAGCLLSGLLSGPRNTPATELAMLDVGQGDAILLRDGRRAVLVDGGGWRRADIGQRVLLPALAALGVRRLEALVLTHPDRDHCGGLVDVASYLPVDEVWTAPGWRGSACARDLLTLPGARLRLLWEGERAELGRWSLRALHPAPGDRRGSNERSLVLVADAHGQKVLLTGDLDAVGERRLLRRHRAALTRVALLKVAHHGSKSSTTEALLAASEPRLALISAGVRNRYGHPSEVVLDRLAARRIRTLVTRRDGLVRVVVTPQGLRVRLPASPRRLH